MEQTKISNTENISENKNRNRNTCHNLNTTNSCQKNIGLMNTHINQNRKNNKKGNK